MFLACPKGYFGASCSSTCQFPSYGAECRLLCSCDQQHCDSITGCTTSGIFMNYSSIIDLWSFSCRVYSSQRQRTVFETNKMKFINNFDNFFVFAIYES